MRETTQAAQGFGNSVAFFDDAGRLLDWTPDFEIEFAAAAPLIGPGASLRSLIAAAYGDDETSLADLAAHSQFDPSRPWADDDAVAKASPRAFDLHRRSGVILRVQEEPSRSGGLVRTARDVTADRRFTGTLFDGEKRWRLDGDPTLEVVSHVNIKPDGHHRPSPFPEEIRRLWGLDAEADISDLPAMFSRLVLTKEEQRHFDATWEHLARTLQPAWLMYRVRDCNGRLTWIEIAITGEREEDGGAFLTLRHRDITREKLAENQLELLQSAVTHASDSIQIVRTSAEGVTTTAYVNPAFEQTTGWRAEELVGVPSL